MQHPGVILRGIVSALFPAPQDLTLFFPLYPAYTPAPPHAPSPFHTLSSLHVPARVRLVGGQLVDKFTGWMAS